MLHSDQKLVALGLRNGTLCEFDLSRPSDLQGSLFLWYLRHIVSEVIELRARLCYEQLIWALVSRSSRASSPPSPNRRMVKYTISPSTLHYPDIRKPRFLSPQNVNSPKRQSSIPRCRRRIPCAAAARILGGLENTGSLDGWLVLDNE
jgi:hypothetical protein